MKNILHAIFCALMFAPAIDFAQPFTLLKDINPGPNNSGITMLGSYFGELLFVANDGVHENELWASDGTAANTQMIKDINPSGGIEVRSNTLILYQSKLYFILNDGAHGLELWVTDGTANGTQMVKDINTSGDAEIRMLVEYKNLLYFFATDGNQITGLWSSDGTANGTNFIAAVGTGNSPLMLAGNLLMFPSNDATHRYELWASDGTAQGTGLIKDVNPVGSAFVDELFAGVAINGIVYFAGYDNQNYGLWRSDGTDAGTYKVKDVQIGTIHNWLFRFHNEIIFVGAGDGTVGIWKSDGTEAGTTILLPYTPGTQGVIFGGGYFNYIGYNPDQTQSLVYFFYDDVVHGLELWRTDGTEQGTFMTKDITPGSGNSFDGYFPTIPFFAASNQIFYFTPSENDLQNELWRSDGTESGTYKVKEYAQETDFAPFNIGPLLEECSNITFIPNLKDPDHGFSLWKTDGTVAGTKFIQDSDPTSPDIGGFASLTEVNGIVFATASTSAAGAELWSTSLAALPISLLEFTGILVGKDAKLNWKTTGEEKNSSYVLERSFDRVNFSPVNTIAAKNIPGTNSYQYLDANITQSGKTYAYYRIKQIEPNRQSSYSNIVAIRMSGGSYWVKVQPNPVNAQLNIQLNSNKPEHSTMSIISMQGVVLMKKEITFRTGMQSITWDIGKLPAGSYILAIKDEEKISKEMFIKN